jgi:hypothetical protein
MSLTFLTPLAGLAAVAALLPVAAAALGARRAARVRRVLRLSPAPGDRLGVGLLVAVPLVLALVATQPALARQSSRHVRADAAVFVVVDVSRSMLASAAPGAPTRLQRARSLAERIRSELPDAPVGLATMTDRVLPMLFPTGDVGAFDSTVQDALKAETPPPLEVAPTATTFDSLGSLGNQGFFPAAARHRVVVLLTDGESEPFDASTVAGELGDTSLIVVRLGGKGERVYVAGKAEAAYRPDPAAAALVAQLTAATGGRSFGPGRASAVAATVRQDFGTGPSRAVPDSVTRTPLGPWLAVAGLIPLGALLRRRLLAAL